jgi:transcriptional regulator, luxR family
MGYTPIHAIFSRMFPPVGKEPLHLAGQQMITFILYSLTLITGLAVNLTGLSGPQGRLPLVLNCIFLGISLMLVLAYRLNRISMRHTFGVMTVVAQLFTCNEMLLCALSRTEYNIMLIVGNMVLLVANVMFSLIGQLRKVPYILGGIGMATYIACVVITDNGILKNFATLYMVMFLSVTVLGNLLVRNIRNLDNENTGLKHDEEEILGLLNMKKEQVMAYIRLSKMKHEAAETKNLLELLGDEARYNVISNVKEAMVAMEMERKSLTEIFPELSPSEIEICRLVIMDRSLNEVCAALGKSESNITCQRSNIRKKLGLQSSDNLKKVLQERFNKGKNG